VRNKLSLSKFLATIETMLLDWSKKSSEDDFQTFPTVDAAKEKEAWKWLKDLNRDSLLHWYGHSYIVPSTRNKHYGSSMWLQEYGTLP
jgi:hypothetical protein